MKTEDRVRLQFLMSPYNLREAQRVRELRNMFIGIGLTISVLAIVAGVMSLLRW